MIYLGRAASEGLRPGANFRPVPGTVSTTSWAKGPWP